MPVYPYASQDQHSRNQGAELGDPNGGGAEKDGVPSPRNISDNFSASIQMSYSMYERLALAGVLHPNRGYLVDEIPRSGKCCGGMRSNVTGTPDLLEMHPETARDLGLVE